LKSSILKKIGIHLLMGIGWNLILGTTASSHSQNLMLSVGVWAQLIWDAQNRGRELRVKETQT
jgi:hypothetical protein